MPDITMTHPDLPDGYYLATHVEHKPCLIPRMRGRWRDTAGGAMTVDPRDFNYILTPLSEIINLQQRLGEVTKERDDILRKSQELCGQNGNLLVEAHDLKNRVEKAEKMAADLARVPRVAGDKLSVSLTEMIRNAGVLIKETEIDSMNLATIPFLCDVIRMCREYGNAMAVRPITTPKGD